MRFGTWFSNTKSHLSAEGCLHSYCQKRFCASFTSPSTYIRSKITKVGWTLVFDPLFANVEWKFFIPPEQLLGCAVWLFGGELPLFSYNSDSSPLSLILIIIIMTMMCTGFRAAFVPLQCQLLPRLVRIITEVPLSTKLRQLQISMCPCNYRTSTFTKETTSLMWPH